MHRLAGLGILAIALQGFAWVVSAGAVATPEAAPTESILSEYTNDAAPDPHPPPYTLLRFNERYDFLADPKNRNDFFDPVKYIPLDPQDPQSYVSFGGELRERYENFRNAGFGTGHGEADPSYLLQRVTLDADVHLNSRLRLFVQGLSGLQFGEQESAAPVNQNPIDVQQLFADYTIGDPSTEGPRVTTRVGRFEMSYGSGRLIATRAAPNLPFKFDGVQIIAAAASARLYGFLVRPGQEYKYHLDGENDGQSFWGIYATAPTRRGFPSTVDFYYLGAHYDNQAYVRGAAAEDRHSIGTRLSGNSGGWNYDWEPIVQFGRFGNHDILAWTLATDTGYTFHTSPWNPRLGLKADIASGDSQGPNGRFGGFNPLYFKSGYFNDASIIRPTNIADLHPSLQAAPTESITVTLAADVLWRSTVKDGVYGPSGNIELRPVAGGSRYIGNTAEAALTWKAGRHLVWTASYVHLFASDYVRAAGGASVDYFGSWATFTW
jgi:hypothetical protein